MSKKRSVFQRIGSFRLTIIAASFLLFIVVFGFQFSIGMFGAWTRVMLYGGSAKVRASMMPLFDQYPVNEPNYQEVDKRLLSGLVNWAKEGAVIVGGPRQNIGVSAFLHADGWWTLCSYEGSG